MASYNSQHRMTTRPRKARPCQQPSTAYPIPPMIISSSSHSHAPSSSSTTNAKKPMRPLTTYHIFFQIEREYLIQTTAGECADKAIHDNKSYLPDVPRRYRSIKLLPDWFAGPGKRQKRKHRKSHGKIGFLELSRIISKRWATLDSADPETKQYVSAIAARELEEYKIEMNEYKELTKHLEPADDDAPSKAPSVPTRKSSRSRRSISISPSSSPSPKMYPMDVPSSSYYGIPAPMMPSLPPAQHQFMTMPPTSSVLEEEEIDYSICHKDNEGHYIPSCSSKRASISDMMQDPLFELDEVFNTNFSSQESGSNTRCVSPVSSSSSGSGNDTSMSDDPLFFL